MSNVDRIPNVAGSRFARRRLFEIGGLGALGLFSPDWLRLGSLAAAAPESAGRRPAKAVILLWLWGGPSHLDTFDLKPDAPAEYRGPYAPIATRTGGVQICELLPQLALQSNRFALIRSMRHDSNDHGIA